MTVHRSKGSENVVQYPREGVQPATVVKVILVVGGLLLVPAGIGAGAGAFYFLHMGLAPSSIISGGATTVGVTSLLIALAIHLCKPKKGRFSPPPEFSSSSEQSSASASQEALSERKSSPPQSSFLLKHASPQQQNPHPSEPSTPKQAPSQKKPSSSEPSSLPEHSSSPVQSSPSKSHSPIVQPSPTQHSSPEKISKKLPSSQKQPHSKMLLFPKKTPFFSHIQDEKKIKIIAENPFKLIDDLIINNGSWMSIHPLYLSLLTLVHKAGIVLKKDFQYLGNFGLLRNNLEEQSYFLHEISNRSAQIFKNISKNPDLKEKLLIKFIKCEKQIQELEKKKIELNYLTESSSSGLRKTKSKFILQEMQGTNPFSPGLPGYQIPYAEIAITIAEQNEFPIVWGANLSEDEIAIPKKDVPTTNFFFKAYAKKTLVVGEDIRVAFTRKRDISRLKTWLTERKLQKSVTVLSMSAARYLYIRNRAKAYVERDKWDMFD